MHIPTFSCVCAQQAAGQPGAVPGKAAACRLSQAECASPDAALPPAHVLAMSCMPRRSNRCSMKTSHSRPDPDFRHMTCIIGRSLASNFGSFHPGAGAGADSGQGKQPAPHCRRHRRAGALMIEKAQSRFHNLGCGPPTLPLALPFRFPTLGSAPLTCCSRAALRRC